MLQRRQAEAKQAVRRHIDEVTFQVGKDSRDMLRHTQRQLRDHYSALAEEVSTSIASSVLAAQNAVSTTDVGAARAASATSRPSWPASTRSPTGPGRWSASLAAGSAR